MKTHSKVKQKWEGEERKGDEADMETQGKTK